MSQPNYLLSDKEQLKWWVQSFYPLWTDWIKSDYCPLTNRQLQIIRAVSRDRSYKQIGHQLSLTATRIHQLVQQTHQQLANCYQTLPQLQADRLLGECDIWNYYTEQEQFLLKPLTAHPLSTRTFNVLRSLGDTLWDIVYYYTENDLKEIRGVGSKTINEVRSLLYQHDCLNTLLNDE